MTIENISIPLRSSEDYGGLVGLIKDLLRQAQSLRFIENSVEDS